ncbi:MAG: PIG-L family deacetylase [Lachnospiraceae bacterium]|nr:PIG-L family deacetylase [Lachnospiraceae bacterium]
MNVLIFAPHRDDEIIGVGGTLLKRKAAGDRVTVCVVTAREGSELPPSTRIIHEEMRKAHVFCGIDEYIGLPFWANNMENFSRSELNKAFYDAIVKAAPEEVYLPFWGDMQKDHQIVTEAAMVALREKYDHPVKRIYAYETLSETGINIPSENYSFIPNVFEDITDFLEDKKTALNFFESQVHPFPDLRSLESVEALAKFRGATVNVKAAEAFMLIRETK